MEGTYLYYLEYASLGLFITSLFWIFYALRNLFRDFGRDRARSELMAAENIPSAPDELIRVEREALSSLVYGKGQSIELVIIKLFYLFVVDPRFNHRAEKYLRDVLISDPSILDTLMLRSNEMALLAREGKLSRHSLSRKDTYHHMYKHEYVERKSREFPSWFLSALSPAVQNAQKKLW